MQKLYPAEYEYKMLDYLIVDGSQEVEFMIRDNTTISRRDLVTEFFTGCKRSKYLLLLL
jgi:hypothetical protein